MTDREAMQQAQLEKLDGTLWILNQELTRKQAAIDALRKLMQQALEALEEYTNVVTSVNDPNSWVTVADGGRPAREAIAALRARLAQPESGCAECGKSGGWALYCVACAEKLFKEPT